MNTTESLFYWIGVAILSVAILAHWLGWLTPAAAVHLLQAGLLLYAGASGRYTRRLRAENNELKRQLSATPT